MCFSKRKVIIFAMKILLVSDSHGNDQILQDLYRQYPKMDLYLHAGDSSLDIEMIWPFISVKGNCDYYPFDDKYRLYTPIGYLLMKHKPFFTADEIKDNKILIHGHTHKAYVKEEHGHILICPGSINLPRDGTEGTYVVLDITTNLLTITIYEINTKNVLYKIEIR